jgi:hypothetical protein
MTDRFQIIKFDKTAITPSQSKSLSKLSLNNNNNRENSDSDSSFVEEEKTIIKSKTEPENQKCFGALKNNNKDISLTKPNPIKLWFATELKSDVILNKRLIIKQDLLKCKSARNMFIKAAKIEINNQLLQELMDLYDREFFECKFYKKLKQQSTNFIIDIGDPVHVFQKGTAAFCKIEGDEVTIAFHKGINDLKFESPPPLSTEVMTTSCTAEEVNGILCYDKIDVLQIILEHELIHLFHQVFLRKPRVNHSQPFIDLCKGIFGHTLYTHAIGHSRGLERVYEEQDRIQKFKNWKVKDLVKLTRLKYSSPQQNFDTDKNEDNHNNFGMIVQIAKEYVTIMSVNGILIEKIPFKELNKIIDDNGDNGSDDDDDDDDGDDSKVDIESKENETELYPKWKLNLERWTELFIKNKSIIQKGSTVFYKLNNHSNSIDSKDTNTIEGIVISKKQSVAQIQISPYFIGLIPYHCLSLSSK